jgi:hypothetical protein
MFFAHIRRTGAHQPRLNQCKQKSKRMPLKHGFHMNCRQLPAQGPHGSGYHFPCFFGACGAEVQVMQARLKTNTTLTATIHIECVLLYSPILNSPEMPFTHGMKK